MSLLSGLMGFPLIGSGVGGSGRGYKPPRRRIPDKVQREKINAAEIKDQRKRGKRAPLSTTYAIVHKDMYGGLLYFSLDRHGYLENDKSMTCWEQGAETAILYRTWDRAYEVSKTFSKDSISIEFVTDEQEFRRRDGKEKTEEKIISAES